MADLFFLQVRLEEQLKQSAEETECISPMTLRDTVCWAEPRLFRTTTV